MSITDPQAAPTPTASAREDFIKRLFAVTLSVGIANQLSHIMSDPNALVNHHIMWNQIFQKWRDLLLLLVSLAIVVSSWEGYLDATRRNPLEDVGRFYVDILLVFAYLLLTLSTEDAEVWFFIHVIIFLAYIAWDILRMRLQTFRPRDRLYEGSLTITVVWFVYFVCLFGVKLWWRDYFDAATGFTAISVAAFAGVVLYRTDKRHRQFWTWRIKLLATGGPLLVLAMLAILKVG